MYIYIHANDLSWKDISMYLLSSSGQKKNLRLRPLCYMYACKLTWWRQAGLISLWK